MQRGQEIFGTLKNRVAKGVETAKGWIGKLNIGKTLGDLAARTVGGVANAGERQLGREKQKTIELLTRGSEIIKSGKEKMNGAKEFLSNTVSSIKDGYDRRNAERGIDKRYSGDISQAMAELQSVTSGAFMAKQRTEAEQLLRDAYSSGDPNQIQSALQYGQETEAGLTPTLIAEKLELLQTRYQELKDAVALAKQGYSSAAQPA